ncbi:Hypothetical protein A7982_08012 [Minicystis rosea]|nr:Hypothetical protein A7982_08012 [Minicystis rosea]
MENAKAISPSAPRARDLRVWDQKGAISESGTATQRGSRDDSQRATGRYASESTSVHTTSPASDAREDRDRGEHALF